MSPVASGAGRPTRVAFPALVAACASLLLLAGTTCPHVFFGDSPELIAAAAELGVAHPPGYPLYTMLGRLALAWPFGEPAWRMNLLSAVCAALTCAGVCLLVQRWTGSAAGGIGAALTLAASSTFWAVSTVAEVYTLHLLLITALLLVATPGALRLGAGARATLAGAFLGLGLSHRPTILLVLPAAALLAGGRRGSRRARQAGARRGVWLGLALAIALPLAFYTWMLLRARAGPPVNWGRPDNLAALWAHVTARRYDSYRVGVAGWHDARNLARLVREAGAGFGFLAPLVALVGGSAAWIAGRQRRPLLAIAALAIPTALFALSYSTPDAEVLLLPSSLALALATGVGLAQAQRGTAARGSALAWLLAAATVVAPLVLHFPRRDLRRFTAAEAYMRDVAGTVPERGVLFVEGDDAFPLAYLTLVLGQRGDMTVFDRSGQLFRDELAEPGSAKRPGEGRLSYRIRREREYLERNAGAREVFFLAWPGYSAPPGLRFEPVGLLQQVRRTALAPRPAAELWKHDAGATIGEQSARVGSTFGLAVAARYPIMRAERALFEGDRERAFGELVRASDVGGASEATRLSVGAIYGRLGEYARAIPEFEEAIRIQPASIRAWNNLGLARALSGDLAGARHAWRRSLAILPDQPEVRGRLSGGGAD